MPLQVIQPHNVHDTSVFAYSHAVRMGDLIFVAGQVAIDPQGKLVGPGDIRGQTEQVFRNLTEVLLAAGSRMENVGKLTVLTTHIEHRVVIHEIRSRIFGAIGHFPASTLAIVSSLANPDWLVEIEAVALA